MNDKIKPNADGTCSQECPEYADVEPGISTSPVCFAQGEGVVAGTWHGAHCPVAYQRLLEVVRLVAGADFVNLRISDALDAVRDLMGEDDE